MFGERHLMPTVTFEVAEMTMKKATTSISPEAVAQSVLRRGRSGDLTPSEEKAMRMRLGAPPPRTADLEWVARGDDDLAIELLAYEIETYLKLRERAAQRPAPAPTASRAKEKIVRALRRKGPTR
jgi:hypothetical protein